MLNARDFDAVALNNVIIHPMYGLPHAKRVKPVSPPRILCGSISLMSSIGFFQVYIAALNDTSDISIHAPPKRRSKSLDAYPARMTAHILMIQALVHIVSF